MIEKFCHKLPVEISRPMYNEYYNRLIEINFIIENRPSYFILKDDIVVIQLILSLSIFYKRVIANINGATVFAESVFKLSNAESIEIGKYKLTFKEKNRILAVVINFNKLVEKYKLSKDLITTLENRDLIRKIRILKIELDKSERPTTDESF